MIGGQVVDVELTGKPIPEKTLRFIFELKTGALIEAAMMIGAQLAGASVNRLLRWRKRPAISAWPSRSRMMCWM